MVFVNRTLTIRGAEWLEQMIGKASNVCNSFRVDDWTAE